MIPKIPPKRIPSDECMVTVGREISDGKITAEGMAYKMHEGEWVDILPVRTLREMTRLVDLRSSKGNDILLSHALKETCEELAKRVMDWNWTDVMGQPLPQPYGHPEIIEGLYSDEIIWLLTQLSGAETTGERKNA